MAYAKKRRLSSLYPYSKGTTVSRYQPYKDKAKKGKKIMYRYTNPQPWWNPKSSPEMKAFDFWDNTGSRIVNTQSVVYIDGGDGANTLNTGYASINRIKQGSAYSNRVGSKVTMKHITVQFNINNDVPFTQGNGNMNQIIRAMLVYDKNPNGVAPNVGHMLENCGMGSVLSNVNSLPNINNMKNRFLFLRDQRLDYDTSQNIQSYRWEINCSLPVVYTGLDTASPTITNIAQGALYFLVFASFQGINTMYLGYVTTRVYFMDQ